MHLLDWNDLIRVLRLRDLALSGLKAYQREIDWESHEERLVFHAFQPEDLAPRMVGQQL